jgi:hypothetical protein
MNKRKAGIGFSNTDWVNSISRCIKTQKQTLLLNHPPTDWYFWNYSRVVSICKNTLVPQHLASNKNSRKSKLYNQQESYLTQFVQKLGSIKVWFCILKVTKEKTKSRLTKLVKFSNNRKGSCNILFIGIEKKLETAMLTNLLQIQESMILSLSET